MPDPTRPRNLRVRVGFLHGSGPRLATLVPIHKKVLIGQQQKHLIAVFSREKGAYGCEVFRQVHKIILKNYTNELKNHLNVLLTIKQTFWFCGLKLHK